MSEKRTKRDRRKADEAQELERAMRSVPVPEMPGGREDGKDAYDKYQNPNVMVQGYVSFKMQLGMNDMIKLGDKHKGDGAYGMYVRASGVLDMTDIDVDLCMEAFGKVIKGVLAELREEAAAAAAEDGDGHG